MSPDAPRSTVLSILTPASRLRQRGFGEPYAQEVFRHLLALEQNRALQTNRDLFLVTVRLQDGMRQQRLSRIASARIFAGLAQCVREVDFIGWLRQDFLAAAVLVQRTAANEAVTGVQDRVMRAVRNQLPAALHDLLVVQVGRFSQEVAS